jgi:hypothetical protein
MRGPETRLRKKIVAALLEKYPTAYVRKIHGNAFQNVGIPDLLCCIEGHFFGLEVKRPGRERRTTPAQVIELKKIREAGGFSSVVTTPEKTLDYVRRRLSGK